MPVATCAPRVVRSLYVPRGAVDHERSDAGLLVRAGSVLVFTADHVAVRALIESAHGAFDLMVAVGPVVEAKPVLYVTVVGVASDVDASDNMSSKVFAMVMLTCNAPGAVEHGAGLELQFCARSADGAIANAITTAKTRFTV